MTRIALCSLLLLGLALSGCASGFNETHYFRSTTTDEHGIPVNYFRLRVSGGTMFSSSRYLSGYFDESAVDAYFNEFSQPDKGQIIATNNTPPGSTLSSTTSGAVPAGGKVEPLDASLAGKKLLLILSSNSDEIANQIGNLAQNAAVATDLEHLFSANQINNANSAVATQQRDQVVASGIVQQAETSLTSLTNLPAPPAVQSNEAMLDLANRLGRYLGSHQSFKSLDDAAEWLRGAGQSVLAKEVP